MDRKPKSLRASELEALRKLTAEERFQMVSDLSERAKQQELQELQNQHPHCSAAEVMQLYIQRLMRESEQKALIGIGFHRH
ncbi:MAG: hypothetical protein JWN70_5281 [Planctomycetaceae bacterium]|nr:hypothetical protein [Planctomycetaceae bacterium]